MRLSRSLFLQVAVVTSTALITVTLKNSSGQQLSQGGQTVVITSSLGTLLGSVQDVGNGTYTQTVQATLLAGRSALKATVGGSSLTNSGSLTLI